MPDGSWTQSGIIRYCPTHHRVWGLSGGQWSQLLVLIVLLIARWTKILHQLSFLLKAIRLLSLFPIVHHSIDGSWDCHPLFPIVFIGGWLVSHPSSSVVFMDRFIRPLSFISLSFYWWIFRLPSFISMRGGGGLNEVMRVRSDYTCRHKCRLSGTVVWEDSTTFNSLPY